MDALRLMIVTLVGIAGIIGFLLVPFSAYSRFDNGNALHGVDNLYIYFDVSLKDDALLVFRMK